MLKRLQRFATGLLIMIVGSTVVLLAVSIWIVFEKWLAGFINSYPWILYIGLVGLIILFAYLIGETID